MIRAVAVAALTVAAAAVLVVAWQVHAWQTSLADDDLRFQARPLAPGLWDAPSGPGAGAAKRLLAVDDDIAFRRAEQLFVRVNVNARSYAAEAQRLAAYGEAQSALEHLADHDPSDTRRARAANLLGILLWKNAASADENAPLLLRQSVEALKRAVRYSSSEGDAKYNLELLTTVLEPTGERRTDAPEDTGTGVSKGAGLAAPGGGY